MKSTATPLRKQRGRLAAMAVLSALVVPGSALACSPIEALFGACQFDVFRPVYSAPRYETRQPRVRHRPHVRPHRAEVRRDETPREVPRQALDESGVSEKQTPLTPTPSAPAGSLALFRQDPTLASGDIVVTNEGFRVYRGGEFRAIAKKGKLADLEKVSMRGLEHETPGHEAQDHRQEVADRRR